MSCGVEGGKGRSWAEFGCVDGLRWERSPHPSVIPGPQSQLYREDSEDRPVLGMDIGEV